MFGLIGKKAGMTQVFDETGTLVPVTVITFEPNVVVGKRTTEKNGYEAVVLGAGDIKPQRASKPYLGQFAEGIAPKRVLRELRGYNTDKDVGESLGLELFENSLFVDVIGVSKGKGYQGVMRRHGFGGGRKTHGSKFHRGNGSTGMAASPSRVIKGTKMAGRMGHDNVTVHNLRLVKVDTDKNALLIQGAVPGPKDTYVFVRGAVKKAR